MMGKIVRRCSFRRNYSGGSSFPKLRKILEMWDLFLDGPDIQ